MSAEDSVPTSSSDMPTSGDLPVFVPCAPDRKLLIIPDVHADRVALLTSWVEAGVISVLDEGNEIEILDGSFTTVLTGDIIDKGPSNFGTLRLIDTLQQDGFPIRITGGNHDIGTRRDALSLSADQLFMEAHINGTFFHALYKHLLRTSKKAPSAKEFKQEAIRICWEEDGPVKRVFDSMELFEVFGGMLITHSMIDDVLAKNIRVNGAQHAQAEMKAMMYQYECRERIDRMTQMTAKRYKDFHNQERVQELNAAGIYRMARGHEIRKDNPQMETLSFPDGSYMEMFHLDAGISSGVGGKSGFAYLKAYPDGSYEGKNHRKTVLNHT